MRLCNRSGIPTGASTKILGYRGQDFEGVKQHLIIMPKVYEMDEPMIMYIIHTYMYYIVLYNICTCIYSPFVRMWRLFFFQYSQKQNQAPNYPIGRPTPRPGPSYQGPRPSYTTSRPSYSSTARQQIKRLI